MTDTTQKIVPKIVIDDEQPIANITLPPNFKKNPEPYVDAANDAAFDLKQKYEIDTHPKSLRGAYYTADEGAFAFYNAFMKKFHMMPVGEPAGGLPKERIIQVQEFKYTDPDGRFYLEQDINDPSIWTTKRLVEYCEKHRPDVVASLPKFIDDSFRPMLAEAMKESLTIIGAPVRELQVAWGIVRYPGEGEIYIYPTEDDEVIPGKSVFRIRMISTKANMHLIKDLMDAVMHELHHNNLYKGRCFIWKDGLTRWYDPFPGTDPENLVFSKNWLNVFENEVLNPIRYWEEAHAMWPTLNSQKVILSGPPGTGKTESTNWIAQEALRKGVSVGYLEPGSNLTALSEFTAFMETNQPGIKIIEDIEGYMPDMEGMTRQQGLEARSLVLSIFDGASSKSVALHTVVTTNYPDIIPSAMLRPGRCDVYLKTEAPDREAFEKLIRMRIGHLLPEDIDFDLLWAEVGNMSSSFLSNGLVVKGMKYALKGGMGYKLSTEDFVAMIASLRTQYELYEANELGERDTKKDTLTEAFTDVVKSANNDMVSTR